MKYISRNSIAIFILAMSADLGLQTQNITRTNKEHTSPAYDSTNAGREFWAAFPTNWDDPGMSGFIRLSITSAVRTQVRVWAGTTLKKTVETIPYGIISVDLTVPDGQIFVYGSEDPPPADGIYQDKALHIEADEPVIIYGMNLTDLSSDGLLMLPVEALGQNYTVENYAAPADFGTTMPSQYMITAPFDGTTVTIHNSQATAGHAAGEIFTIHLNRGDVWSSLTTENGGDISGTIISANRPVAVTAGVKCAYIPNTSACCCSHITEMLLPTKTWGKAYHGVPFHNRRKGDFWRIFAREPHTTVLINGMVHTTTLGKIGGQGWFEYRKSDTSVVEFRADNWLEYQTSDTSLVEFTADKPIHVMQFNASSSHDSTRSNPFSIGLVPVEQYVSEAIIATPALLDDKLPLNYISIVSDEENFHTIEISSMNSDNWRPLQKMDLVGAPRTYGTAIDGKMYTAMTVRIDPGVYRLRSAGKFGGYIHGSGDFTSYGYPFATGTKALNKDIHVSSVAVENDSTASGPMLSLVESTEGRGHSYMIPIRYRLSMSGIVSVSLVDMSGRKIRMYTKEKRREPGLHSQLLDLSGIPRGTYSVQVSSGSETVHHLIVIEHMMQP